MPPSPPESSRTSSRVLWILIGGVLLWLIVSWMQPVVERSPLEQEPPGVKRLEFVVTPPDLARTHVALVEEDGSQTVHDVRRPVEVELVGEVHWTVLAPGHPSRSGTLVLPHGTPRDGPIRVEVDLRRRSEPRTAVTPPGAR